MRKGNEPIHEAHKACDSQAEQSSCSANPCCHDLCNGQMFSFTDCHCSNGLHGLDRHGNSEKQACDDVVDPCECQCGAQIKSIYQCENNYDGNERTQVPQWSIHIWPYCFTMQIALETYPGSSVTWLCEFWRVLTVAFDKDLSISTTFLKICIKTQWIFLDFQWHICKTRSATNIKNTDSHTGSLQGNKNTIR